MRRPLSRARPVRAAALVCFLALGACKKEQPAPVAVPSAPASAPAEAAKDAGTAVVVTDTKTPFTFKDVKIVRTGSEVKLTYTLVNQGARGTRRRRTRPRSGPWRNSRRGSWSSSSRT
jgi:uncharacterized lipoprotein YehR (DUF1307 family)